MSDLESLWSILDVSDPKFWEYSVFATFLVFFIITIIFVQKLFSKYLAKVEDIDNYQELVQGGIYKMSVDQAQKLIAEGKIKSVKDKLTIYSL